ncbi:MAG: hypothetical protein GF317_06810 [Candidatus Lokiarchaeota archaeon]|nr:hypothetical protein [Candidatus Lokiarchaeota archaeon]MBD3199420.1 hypothetical protein [Candidatus Lokiarchaeota archaeon]
MESKKILLSAKIEDPLIHNIYQLLKARGKIELYHHNPSINSINLLSIRKFIQELDLIITKVGGDSSVDLLYIAQEYNIPMINNLKSILLCKNRIALDNSLRTLLKKYSKELGIFNLPKSWSHPSPYKNIQEFKRWVSERLPIVLKTHDQHNEYVRFNFLAKTTDEIDDFVLRYKDFLYFDLYFQEFIECDGFDRKIYVIGDKIFGIKRENPIYLYLREKPEKIDVSQIKREEFVVEKDIKTLAKLISKEFDLKIYGFDLVKIPKSDKYYIIDLNDFPGFKGIENAAELIVEYISKFL